MPPLVNALGSLAIIAVIVGAGCTAGDPDRRDAPVTSNAPAEVRERWDLGPDPEPVARPAPAPTLSAPARSTVPGRPDLPDLVETREITYVVEPGDTATVVASEHGITLATLLELNPEVTNPDLLSVGQRLIVGERDTIVSTSTQAPSTRPTGTPLARPNEPSGPCLTTAEQAWIDQLAVLLPLAGETLGILGELFTLAGADPLLLFDPQWQTVTAGALVNMETAAKELDAITAPTERTRRVQRTVDAMAREMHRAVEDVVAGIDELDVDRLTQANAHMERIGTLAAQGTDQIEELCE